MMTMQKINSTIDCIRFILYPTDNDENRIDHMQGDDRKFMYLHRWNKLIILLPDLLVHMSLLQTFILRATILKPNFNL